MLAVDDSLPLLLGLALGLFFGGLLRTWTRRSQASTATGNKAPLIASQYPSPQSCPARQGGQGQQGEDPCVIAAALDAMGTALMVYDDAGRIAFVNRSAKMLLFADSDPTARSFLSIVEEASPAVRRLLLADEDGLVTTEVNGQREVFDVRRETYELAGKPQVVHSVHLLTSAVAQHDSTVLRKLVRVLSHELNHSWASVSSLLHSARALVHGENPARLPQLDGVLGAAQDRSQHLLAFLDGYTKLARLPTPNPVLQPLRPMLSRLQELYPKLEVLGEHQAHARFDEVQTEQVLINLVKNAYEAGGSEDEVRLQVQVVARRVDILVLDRGEGLSEEAAERAVLPFFTTKAEGSGLGLALSREIMAAQDGMLTLSNREGRGAIARCSFPIEAPDFKQTLSRAALTLNEPRLTQYEGRSPSVPSPSNSPH